MTFQLLKEHGKTALFPNEYLSIERSAESNLANWLEFPTELNSCPDEIEHLVKVTIGKDSKECHYHVFKFRVYEPHWAASKGWMLGVTGPYYSNSLHYLLFFIEMFAWTHRTSSNGVTLSIFLSRL